MEKELKSRNIDNLVVILQEKLKSCSNSENVICPGVSENKICVDLFARDIYMCEGCRVMEHLRDETDIFVSNDYKIIKLD